MDKLLQLIEAHAIKFVGVPFAINSIQFLLMLIHAMSDGVIDHDELEALLQAGNGTSMILLACAMAYLKLRKK